MYKYYYKLEEAATLGPIRPWKEILHVGTQPNFKDLCDMFMDSVPTWVTADATYVNEIWELIRAMFQQDGVYFFVSDNNYDITTTGGIDGIHTEARNRIRDLINTVYNTKDYYISLIQAQAILKNEATADIVAATNETYFNDTPQNTGSYTTDDYNTTYTKTVSKIGVGTVPAKLQAVADSNRDYYMDWLENFKRFRIYD